MLQVNSESSPSFDFFRLTLVIYMYPVYWLLKIQSSVHFAIKRIFISKSLGEQQEIIQYVEANSPGIKQKIF